MIPTFVIFLREGVEASMIVAILLSYLDQIGQRRHFRDVFIGVAAATVLVVAGGISAYLVIHQYSGSTVQTVFETVTFLLAATVLTYMTFWMQSHSRTMLVRAAAAVRCGSRGEGPGGDSGCWPSRRSAVKASRRWCSPWPSCSPRTKQAPTSAHGHGLLLGAVLGLAVALAIAYAIFKLGKRLNIGLFFRIIGIVLMVFAAGLLVDAVENMQELGWLPFLDHMLWNTSTYLSEVELHRRRVPQPARATPTSRPSSSPRVGHLPGRCHHRLRRRWGAGAVTLPRRRRRPGRTAHRRPSR